MAAVILSGRPMEVTTFVQLTQNKFAIVDAENFDWLSQTRWSYTEQGYAVRGYNSGKREYMHRLVADAKKGEIVDHINFNKLDNRKSNLRIVSRSFNSFHRRNVKGVSKSGIGWEASLFDHGKRHRKWFLTKAEALVARKHFESLRRDK